MYCFFRFYNGSTWGYNRYSEHIAICVVRTKADYEWTETNL